ECRGHDVPGREGAGARGVPGRRDSGARDQAEHRGVRDELPELRADGVRRPERQLRVLLPGDPPMLAVRTGTTRAGPRDRERPRNGDRGQRAPQGSRSRANDRAVDPTHATDEEFRMIDDGYVTDDARGDDWHLMLGDS